MHLPDTVVITHPTMPSVYGDPAADFGTSTTSTVRGYLLPGGASVFLHPLAEVEVGDRIETLGARFAVESATTLRATSGRRIGVSAKLRRLPS